MTLIFSEYIIFFYEGYQVTFVIFRKTLQQQLWIKLCSYSQNMLSTYVLGILQITFFFVFTGIFSPKLCEIFNVFSRFQNTRIICLVFICLNQLKYLQLILQQLNWMKTQNIEEPNKEQSKLVEKNVKSRHLLKLMKQENCDFKFYNWDFKENYIYITYLQNFRQIFVSHSERKRVKVFSHLSKLLQTRNPHQIKSHHQKMMLRHRSIDAIIQFLRLNIIKYLKNNPESIPQIKAINKYAEVFYLNEIGPSGKLNQKVENNQEEQNLEQQKQEEREQAKMEVRIQEDDSKYIYKGINPSVSEQQNGQQSNNRYIQSKEIYSDQD